MRIWVVVFSVILVVCLFISSVNGSQSKSIVIGLSGQIDTVHVQNNKYVATLLISWNEYYFGQVSNWSQSSLFTPDLGSYLESYAPTANKTVIDQQIVWMQKAGIDICFVTVNCDNGVDIMNLFMNEAASLNSTVKFAPYFNGSNFSNSTGNLALTGTQAMWNAGIFTNPQDFKYDGKPVISGYLPNPNDGYDPSYWIAVHSTYPNLSIWADGWYPDYWNALDGAVDAMVVFDFSQSASTQLNYYIAAEKHPLSIHVFPMTAGFDDTAIGGSLPKLSRDNGQTFIDCWNKLSTLPKAPDVVWVGTWNDYGECSGIEPISSSRSSTTTAFGDLYLNITSEYGNLFKNGEL